MISGKMPNKYIQRQDSPRVDPTRIQTPEISTPPIEKPDCSRPAPLVRHFSGQTSCNNEVPTPHSAPMPTPVKKRVKAKGISEYVAAESVVATLKSKTLALS